VLAGEAEQDAEWAAEEALAAAEVAKAASQRVPEATVCAPVAVRPCRTSWECLALRGSAPSAAL